jgi:hypothetical protein
MRISSLALLFVASIANLFATDVIQLRFSEQTISAIKDAQDYTIASLTDIPPQPKYDKIHGKMILEPVLRWLVQHCQNGKNISATSFAQFADILLNPENHYGGLFAVGDPRKFAIQFNADGKTGYITLGSSLVIVYWDGRDEAALLNDSGRKALKQWMLENG